MQFNPSKVVSVSSCAAVVFATLATVWWVWYVFFVEYNFLFDVTFTLFAGTVNVGVLILVVIPSNILYFRTREPRDLTSLFLSGSAFMIVLVETVLVWMIPLHGA